jgi:outer membrane cobalamin receptor
VLTAQELVRRNATTLDQALAFEPGVTFNAGQMDIRGSTGLARGVGSRVLLLLDGHPILSGDGGEIDFASLPLLDVDRVEVVKGAYSALYGSNALGGVVNVLTAPVSEQPHTVARVHYGSYQFPDRFRYTDEQVTTAGLGIQHSRQLGVWAPGSFWDGNRTTGFARTRTRRGGWPA